MRRARILNIAAASLWLAACQDSTGPPSTPPAQDRVLHQLRWSSDLGSPTFGARGGGSSFQRFESPGQSEVRVLDSYETGFWARWGSNTGVEIHYRAADGTWQPYIRLTVPSDAPERRPDGGAFAAGDSVWITVAIDSVHLLVQLEPTGLVFNETSPARLDVWYIGADPDLDGSGAVNDADRYIEATLLGVWVQERTGTPWSAVTSVHSLDRKLFTTGLRHFSQYAVSH